MLADRRDVPSWLGNLAFTALFFAGVAAVVYGIWMIYPPAAWIVAGFLAATFAATAVVTAASGPPA